MTPIERAKIILEDNSLSCVVIDTQKNKEFTSADSGIKPLLLWLKEDIDYFKDKVVADKVIGKAAAMLLIKGKVKELYATIISEHACSVLESNNIPYSFDKKVPYIINRTKTGMCPMESAVLDTDDIDNAYDILKAKIQL